MKLKDYLRNEGITKVGFARKSGISIVSIASLCKGLDCRLTTALKVERATRGEVTLYDLAPTKGPRIRNKKKLHDQIK